MDNFTVTVAGTDIVLNASWNDIDVIFPDGSKETITDAYADSEYKLTGKIMDMIASDNDEKFDEIQESVWNAVGECFSWERDAYFDWEEGSRS